MLIPYWIQKADLTSEDFDAVDYKQAQVALKKIDWRKEIQKQRELEHIGKENCDPGIGFVADDGRILHICQDGKGKAYFHYHFSETRKIFGIIPFKFDQVASRMSIVEYELAEVIRRFYLEDHEWLINKTKDRV